MRRLYVLHRGALARSLVCVCVWTSREISRFRPLALAHFWLLERPALICLPSSRAGPKHVRVASCTNHFSCSTDLACQRAPRAVDCALFGPRRFGRLQAPIIAGPNKHIRRLYVRISAPLCALFASFCTPIRLTEIK